MNHEHTAVIEEIRSRLNNEDVSPRHREDLAMDYVAEALAQAEQRGREEEREEIRAFLIEEKKTYSEDVAKRERDVYDHLILCLDAGEARNPHQ